MTEAFRLRSASVGGCASCGKTSGDGAETCNLSMRAAAGAVGGKGEGRRREQSVCWRDNNYSEEGKKKRVQICRILKAMGSTQQNKRPSAPL